MYRLRASTVALISHTHKKWTQWNLIIAQTQSADRLQKWWTCELMLPANWIHFFNNALPEEKKTTTIKLTSIYMFYLDSSTLLCFSLFLVDWFKKQWIRTVKVRICEHLTVWFGWKKRLEIEFEMTTVKCVTYLEYFQCAKKKPTASVSHTYIYLYNSLIMHHDRISCGCACVFSLQFFFPLGFCQFIYIITNTMKGLSKKRIN